MTTRKTFEKPALSIEDQISLLESRGLHVDDRAFAYKVLSNINYYHLEGYWYSFYDKSKPDHHFYDNVNCSQVVRYFEFDNELRMLLFAAISKIELSFRTRFIYEIAMEYGASPFKNKISISMLSHIGRNLMKDFWMISNIRKKNTSFTIRKHMKKRFLLSGLWEN